MRVCPSSGPLSPLPKFCPNVHAWINESNSSNKRDRAEGLNSQELSRGCWRLMWRLTISKQRDSGCKANEGTLFKARSLYCWRLQAGKFSLRFRRSLLHIFYPLFHSRTPFRVTLQRCNCSAVVGLEHVPWMPARGGGFGIFVPVGWKCSAPSDWKATIVQWTLTWHFSKLYYLLLAKIKGSL